MIGVWFLLPENNFSFSSFKSKLSLELQIGLRLEVRQDQPHMRREYDCG